MSTILYIGKDYCHTLEQLQDYFCQISSGQDALYNELLTLQLDGLITQWLQEGTETEKILAKRIMSLPTELSNTDLMKDLVKILTNRNTFFSVNLYSYIDLKEVSYTLIRSSQAEGIFKVVSKGDVLNIKEEHLQERLRLKLKFKILKPEKETFRLKAILSLQQEIIHESATDLCLNNEITGKEKYLYFDIPICLVRKRFESYLLEVKSDSQTLYSIEMSLDKDIEIYIRNIAKNNFGYENDKFDMVWNMCMVEMTLKEKPFFEEILPQIKDSKKYKELERILSKLR